MADNNEEFIDPEVLANGRVLLSLKHRFLQQKCDENLLPVMGCLRDSKVLLPIEMDYAANEGLDQAGEEGTIMKPELLRSGEYLYIPIYTNADQIPEDHREDTTTVKTTVLECIKLAKANEDVYGLALDPFTEALIIDDKMMNFIPGIVSKIKPEM